MPVQINELIIRAVVVTEAEKENNAAAKPTIESTVEKSDVVKECVAIVMDLLNKKSER